MERDLGLISYAEGLRFQEEVHEAVANGSKDSLLLCEHNHVYTFGKSADHNNLLISEEFLKSIQAEVHQTERGGDITYHGPGQLVGYPIVNLRKAGIGVKSYVRLLEESIILSLQEFGINAYRINGLIGIWVGKENEIKQKIGAIGIRIKNGVSKHGFALNITTNLSYFNHIVPCGIADKQVTSIQQLKGTADINQVKSIFTKHFWQQFNQHKSS